MTAPVTLARAHAKINLELRILGRRSDGYHELRTVFQTLALHDTLACIPCRGPFRIECDAPGVPTDDRNLIWRAADLLWHRLERSGPLRDVRVRLRKRIPMQAGLGGGSSDAAAALMALAQVWGAALSREQLASVASQLGADVPFFLCGGTARGLGRGDEIHPMPDMPPGGVVLLVPSFGVSTADAYAWWGEHRRAVTQHPTGSAVSLPAAWPAGVTVGNDLQGPIGVRHPDIDRMIAALREAGATAASMTGSGSVVFGLFETSAAARDACVRLRAAGWRAISTRFLDRAACARASRPIARARHVRHAS